MKQLDLLRGRILPTMIRLAMPLMGTAFIQMFYNLTDMAWIGRLSTDAVAAVGQVGFMMWIGNSLALVPRIGMSVLLGQYYGGSNHDHAKQSINNGLFLALVMGIIYGAILFIFRVPLIQFYNLEPHVNELTEAYLVIICLGMPLFFLNPVLSGAYNSLGNSRTPFIINTLGLIVNIIGDPLLIFGWGPFPALGIRGAAIATVTAQVVVFIGFIREVIINRDYIYESQPWRFKFEPFIMKQLIKLGFPASFQSNTHAFVSVWLNRYVASYGAMPLAVASIGSNIESISWMTTEGFAAATTAFTAQNFGAKLMDRVRDVYKTSLLTIAAIGIFATIILIVFRYPLFAIFVPGDQEAIALGAVYLFIFGLSQFFMSLEIGSAGFLNGIGDTNTPAVTSIIFNVLRIPLALVLMPHYGVAGVWMSMSFSSVIKGILLWYLSRRKLNRVLELYPSIF